MSDLPLAADGPLKSKIIALAFEDAGMSDLTVSPEERSMALRKLNTMMTDEPWANIPYAQPDYGDGNANEPSGIPIVAMNGVAKHLSLILMSDLGIEPSTAFRPAYARAMLQIGARYAASRDITEFRPGTIRGAGARNRTRFGPYFVS